MAFNFKAMEGWRRNGIDIHVASDGENGGFIYETNDSILMKEEHFAWTSSSSSPWVRCTTHNA
jgi:hypothetical protein